MRERLRAWLKLGRVSHLPAGLSGATVGFYLGGGSIEGSPEGWAASVAATGCLFVAGSIMNDLFDLKQDREEHPERPIPSGRIGVMSAWLVSVVLVIAGLGIVQTVLPQAMWIAVALLSLIHAYNLLPRGLQLSAVLKGGSRAGVYLLGAAAAGATGQGLTNLSIWGIALALGAYMCAVTIFARREFRVLPAAHRVLAAVVAFAAFPLPVLASWEASPDPYLRGILYGVIAVAVLWGISVARTLIAEGKTAHSIGKLASGICLLDALVLARLGSVEGAILAGAGFLVAFAVHARFPGLPALLTRR